MDRQWDFRFQCTPDPQRPGYCIESFGGVSVEVTKQMADQLLCAQRMVEWLRIEREARAAVHEPAS